MLRSRSSRRAAAAISVAATLALVACSSSSSTGLASPAGSADSAKTLPAFNVSQTQLNATLHRLFLGPYDMSSLSPVVQYAVKMDATPLTAEQTAWLTSCLSKEVCPTGHGTLIVAMPSQDISNSSERLTESEFLWAIAHFPQVKEVIRNNANGDLSTYLSNIRAAIGQGANIIVSDVSYFASSLLPVVKEAKARGIIFVPVSAPITGASVPADLPTAYAGGDPCAATKELAESAIKLQGDNRQYAVYTGTPGNSYGTLWEGCLAQNLKSPAGNRYCRATRTGLPRVSSRPLLRCSPPARRLTHCSTTSTPRLSPKP